MNPGPILTATLADYHVNIKKYLEGVTNNGAVTLDSRNLFKCPDVNEAMETESNSYWDERYLEDSTPWDIGYANPGIVKYVKDNFPVTTRILIPGAGVGHEAAALQEEGFKNVFVNEWSHAAKRRMLEVYPGFPEENILIGDFFALDGHYNLILEQTFFCALQPTRRLDYVKKVKALLAQDGILAGVFFDRTFMDAGPPFGGEAEEYLLLFSKEFEVNIKTPWNDSIPPRAGTECWLEARVSGN